jgi:hypothetical protein
LAYEFNHKVTGGKGLSIQGGIIPEANWLAGMAKPKLGLHKTWLKLLMRRCLAAILKLGSVFIFMGRR